MQSLHPIKKECKFILPKPFSCDYGRYNASEFKVGDQVESIFGIKDEVQLDLDLDLIPTPNPPTAEKQNATESCHCCHKNTSTCKGNHPMEIRRKPHRNTPKSPTEKNG